MKVQVRQGVFETNSSSTHAISVMAYNSDALCIPKSVHFSLNGEFGWEWETYSDANTKACYFWIATCYKYTDMKHKDKLEEIKNTITEWLTEVGVETVTFDTADYVESSWRDDGSTYLDFNGYIDHGDLASFVEDMISSKERFLSYLLNCDSIVATGNDNDSDCHTLNIDGMAEVIYHKGN